MSNEQTNERKFVYVILSQNEKGNGISSNQADELAKYPAYLYGMHETYEDALAEVFDIYKKGILGVKNGIEYLIVKKEVINKHKTIKSL